MDERLRSDRPEATADLPPDTEPFAGLEQETLVRANEVDQRGRTHAVLVELEGAQAGAVFRVEPPGLVIGRSGGAEVILDDSTVSWRHVRVTIEEGAVLVEDLASRNGTFVNERRISGRTRLEKGDYLGVGGGSTLFKLAKMDEFEEGVLRKLFDLAQRDPLTGLHNRRYFEERLHSEFRFADRHDTTLGLLFADIDHFKRVNDVRGHAAGDAVLKLVAHTIRRMMRPEDVFSRFGGEEFVAIVRATSLRNLEILGTRICWRVQAMARMLADPSLGVTVSVGVSLTNPERRYDSADALLASADRALYQAKARGGNRVFLAPVPSSGVRAIP